MSDRAAEQSKASIVFECDLDAPLEKVWRAISIPELRQQWLPEQDLADAAVISAEPGEEVRLRMRPEASSSLDSIVTFQICPGLDGGTRLTITHQLVNLRSLQRTPPAANCNGPVLMLAA